MGLYDLLKPLAFSLDAETAHEMGLGLIARGAVAGPRFPDPRLELQFVGLQFENPLGIAAGFDKNAEGVESWENFGFGFAELGTVTYQPQPGNPRPRLFRLPREGALINSLGFPNVGAKAVASRLRESRPAIPIGVNIGKSAKTPAGKAVSDYLDSFRLLAPWANYVAVNVSSPNTPGLRDLQSLGPLTEILSALREERAETPLFVKVAPDLSSEELDDVICAVESTGTAGIIATNTTVRHDVLPEDPGFPGGISGKPLRKLADEELAYLAKGVGEKTLLIGVGGIFCGEDLFRKISLGAHLCQAYTGFVYKGPSFAANCLRGLVALMEQRGIKSLSELRRSALSDKK